MEWTNLSLFVTVSKIEVSVGLTTNKFIQPLLQNKEEHNDMVDEGLPNLQLKPIAGNKNLFKQIFCEQNGYVKTQELVGIMGPSGSGKTSLLNTLS